MFHKRYDENKKKEMEKKIPVGETFALELPLHSIRKIL